MDPFFKSFWIRRSAMETKFREQLISTTVEIAKRVGGQQILHRILRSLKDENEPFRMMTLETIYRIIHLLGTNDLTEENEVVYLELCSIEHSRIVSLMESTMSSSIKLPLNHLFWYEMWRAF